MKSNSSLKTVVFTGILGLLCLSGTAFANERNYVFTEEYKTLPKGGIELESWTKFKVPDRHTTNDNEIEYQQELEYGVTDHLTLAHYQSWETINQVGPDDATVYKGFKFESKYRIGEKGKYFVDPLIYLEWATEPREDNPNEIEAKGVLSKDFGDLNITYNQIMESALGRGGRTDQKFTFASSYALPFDVRVGFELKGDYWRASSHENRLALGPVISWTGKYFWISTGAAFGINHHADDVEARIVVGASL